MFTANPMLLRIAWEPLSAVYKSSQISQSKYMSFGLRISWSLLKCPKSSLFVREGIRTGVSARTT